MEYEVSCGGVVYTRQNNEILYVIIESLDGYYGFPKGHVEVNEADEQTAIREIYEETGLEVKIIPGFKTVEEYLIPNKKNVIKRIVYFVSKYDKQDIVYPRQELLGAYLMTYEEAIDVFQFESKKRILHEANNFISSREQIHKNDFL